MYSETEDVIRALAENAESVCRAYLPAGRREGSYWIVGDLQNNPGRSLFVRLTGPTSGPGARGKWQDAAVGLHGDLLDIIPGALLDRAQDPFEKLGARVGVREVLSARHDVGFDQGTAMRSQAQCIEPFADDLFDPIGVVLGTISDDHGRFCLGHEPLLSGARVSFARMAARGARHALIAYENRYA